MTGKQKQKLRKRAKAVATRSIQDEWIEDAFGVVATTRRERQRLFAQAKPIVEKKHAAR
ncbi:hypothetical protein [Ralstonia insidiosa]|uniref:hypothetical protein n=1 Tax=Ralstonia insidiosa TaxID=190721 RepID=UPI001427AD38|nr:hypothetical protein [Ralstonia insidiosa]